MNENDARPGPRDVPGRRLSSLSCLRYPATSGLLRPIIIGSFGLSLWQSSQSLFRLFPQLPAYAARTVQALAGLSGFMVLLVTPGMLAGLISGTAKGNGSGLSGMEISGKMETVVKDSLKAAAIFLWSFLPLEIYLALAVKGGGAPSYGLVGVLVLLGLGYFPMALLMLAVSGRTLPSLLVSNVLEPAARTAGSYAGFLFPFWTLMLLPLAGLQLWPVPFIGPWAACFILLYSWSCAMKLLGEFYLLNKDTIGKP